MKGCYRVVIYLWIRSLVFRSVQEARSLQISGIGAWEFESEFGVGAYKCADNFVQVLDPCGRVPHAGYLYCSACVKWRGSRPGCQRGVKHGDGFGFCYTGNTIEVL